MSQPVFTFEERIGLLFTVEAATLSICAVTIILCYALFKWVRTWGHNELKSSEASDSILFLNLMFAGLIQGIGAMPNVKWMSDGYITDGQLCTAQAAIKQVGIVGVAMTTLAIALYTFFVLLFRKDRTMPKHTAKVIVACVWIFVAIVIGIPNAAFRNVKYYGPTTYWCWILTIHETEQIVTEYLWVWIAALSNLVLYPVMFLVMRGWIGKRKVDDQTDHVEVHTLGQPRTAEKIETERTKKVAQMMLYYPLIYLVCTLPNTVSRWLQFKGYNPSPEFTLAANTLFDLSGLLDFILFLITRPSWVVGDRRRGEHRPLSGSQADSYGRSPPEISEVASRRPLSESHSSAIMMRDRVDSSTLFLSPRSQTSHPLPPVSDDGYGYLPPGH